MFYHPSLSLSIQCYPGASNMFVYTLRGHLLMLTLLIAEINSEARQRGRSDLSSSTVSHWGYKLFKCSCRSRIVATVELSIWVFYCLHSKLKHQMCWCDFLLGFQCMQCFIRQREKIRCCDIHTKRRRIWYVKRSHLVSTHTVSLV